MVCRHCVAAVAGALSDMGFHTAEVRLGKAVINAEELTPDKYAEIDRRLNALGFVRIQDPNTAIVERAKLAVIDHVRNETECRKNLSACMEEHLDMYNPQNETEDGNKSKRPKIKTKRDSPQNEAYLRVRFFNRPPYPIFAPKSTRLRRGQG